MVYQAPLLRVSCKIWPTQTVLPHAKDVSETILRSLVQNVTAVPAPHKVSVERTTVDVSEIQVCKRCVLVFSITEKLPLSTLTAFPGKSVALAQRTFCDVLDTNIGGVWF